MVASLLSLLRLAFFSIRDLAPIIAVIAAERSPERVNIYEIMSKPVITLPEEMDIKYGIRLLVQFGLSRTLVVDHDHKLCGLVTMRDMVLRYAKRQAR